MREGTPLPHGVQLILALKREERRHLAGQRLQCNHSTGEKRYGNANYYVMEWTAVYS